LTNQSPEADDAEIRESSIQEHGVRLYQYAIVQPDWTLEIAAQHLDLPIETIKLATLELTRLSLLRPSLDPARQYDAVSPESAASILLQREERDIAERQAQVAAVRGDLLALLPTYYSARQRRRRFEAIDVIEDVMLVRQHLSTEADSAQEEISIAHPGPGMEEANLERSIALDIPVLRRGVVIRSILQHSTRHHRPTARYVTEVVQHGAVVRTAPIIPGRVLVFDRRIAFIPIAGDEPANGAVLVREPAVVAQLLANFELLWENARTYPTDDADGLEDALDEVTHAILQQMAAGAKDELIARRMAISLRTCRRHIATIMSTLGASSRFEAGVLAQRQGLLD
jgi:DNA-binding CsgD family transcriptional regulator